MLYCRPFEHLVDGRNILVVAVTFRCEGNCFGELERRGGRNGVAEGAMSGRERRRERIWLYWERQRRGAARWDAGSGC